MQGSRGRGQFRGDRGDSRGHRGGFRDRGRGQHGQRGSFLSSRGGHESSTSKHGKLLLNLLQCSRYCCLAEWRLDNIDTAGENWKPGFG